MTQKCFSQTKTSKTFSELNILQLTSSVDLPLFLNESFAIKKSAWREILIAKVGESQPYQNKFLNSDYEGFFLGTFKDLILKQIYFSLRPNY